MKSLTVLLSVLFAVAVVVPAVAQSELLKIPDESEIEPAPEEEGVRPEWADPEARSPDVGVNDDPTPFDPADVGSGPSPLETGPSF